MEELLLQGGDTDTNAAILGMVLGARDGFSALDDEMVDTVTKFDSFKGGHKRPEFLIPGKNMLVKLDHFLSCLP